jgi:hypothetical protein
MVCPFCEWEMGLGGTVDPAEVVLSFEDHLQEHVEEMTR